MVAGRGAVLRVVALVGIGLGTAPSGLSFSALQSRVVQVPSCDLSENIHNSPDVLHLKSRFDLCRQRHYGRRRLRILSCSSSVCTTPPNDGSISDDKRLDPVASEASSSQHQHEQQLTHEYDSYVTATASDERGSSDLYGRRNKGWPAGMTGGRVLRSMGREDIDDVVSLAFQEYFEGSLDLLQPAASSASFNSAGGGWGMGQRTPGWNIFSDIWTDADVERLLDRLEMEWLRTIIRWGFGMRIDIGEQGQDHRVFCVAETKSSAYTKARGGLVAVAEISLQVPNGKPAPPLPMPLWLKKILGWATPVQPYISNVLVDPGNRRLGLATRLMARCEEQAKSWGYHQVFLHVDLGYSPAVYLYDSLGYEVVDVDPAIQESHVPRLRYMKKSL